MNRYLAILECRLINAKRSFRRAAFRDAVNIEVRIMAGTDKNIPLILILDLAAFMGTVNIDCNKSIFSGSYNQQIFIDLIDRQMIRSADFFQLRRIFNPQWDLAIPMENSASRR